MIGDNGFVMMFSYWGQKGFFNRPPIGHDSAGKRYGANSKANSPFFKGLGFSPKFYEMISASVINLFFFRSPFAIGRFIITIIINSFKRMFGSVRGPHILKKISKGMPTFTHLYSPFSIKTISGIFRIMTSVVHRRPNFIQMRTCHPMFTEHQRSIFSSKATAGLGNTALKLTVFDSGFISTITQANIFCYYLILRVFKRKSFKNLQSPKFLSGKISHRNIIYG
jgi:hypothetical protein